MTIKSDIAELLRKAVAEAISRDLLPDTDSDDAAVEQPQSPEHGDFASSLPLKLARPMRMDPMTIAETVAGLIPVEGFLGKVSAAPPGFINFALNGRWLAQQVDVIRKSGPLYGNLDMGKGLRVQVEFVSVNPTGPLHVGHARGAVFGSTLADILTAAGYEVQKEYYVNDAGTQMDLFGRTLHARYLQALGEQAQVPSDGYQGSYMVDLAEEVKAEHGDRFLHIDEGEATAELTEIGLDKMLQAIREDLEKLRVEFDVWFSERSLFTDGQYERAMRLLEDRGFVVEREGARWFTSTELGDDKDNVLVRSTGAPTYFASDVAYHFGKFFERKFDRVIDVWGADHQGHVSRMHAVTEALGVPSEGLTLIISQMVSLKSGGQVMRVSKRTGELITLRELIAEVGPDACRFFFLSRSPESQMDFDIELARKESSENPVYYVQYAHARIASILRLAQEKGIEYEDGEPALLVHEAELALLRKMVILPELIETMARKLEPHHLAHYAMDLATAFHWFYQQCRVVSSRAEDARLTKARLKLVEAAKIVLARCLGLMSMSAPEEM